MPLVFRAMKKDDDGLPTIEASATGLGVRIGTDVNMQDGQLLANGKGLSVAPDWRLLPIFRIPKRLCDQVSGARGSNQTYCFRFGSGPFERAPFAESLELVPDSPAHGCVAPARSVSLEQFESDLSATRAGWQIDER